MIKLVDRYLGRACILGTLLAWSALILLSMLLALLGEFRSMQNDYTTGDVFWFVALTTPQLAYQVFPIAALLGALIGVGGLAAAHELIAFRTSGVSRLRLAAAALAGTALLTIPVLIMGEWVAPAAEHQARAFRLSEMVGVAIIGGPRGVWLRDGSDIVNIQLPVLSADRGRQSVAFNNVVIYSFLNQVELKSITRASSATHSSGTWTLHHVNEVSFDDQGANASQQDRRNWATEVKPELLDSAVTRPRRLSLRSLTEYLRYLRENGLNDAVYQAALWDKLVFPFTVIALVLAGMPFVFSTVRSKNVGVRLFLGMILGGVFMIVNRMVQNFGDAYQIHTALTHVLPSLAMAVGGIMVLRRTA